MWFHALSSSVVTKKTSLNVYIVGELNLIERYKMNSIIMLLNSLISFTEAWSENNGQYLEAQSILLIITFVFLIFTESGVAMFWG